MTSSSRGTTYFVAGGTLRPDVPSYVQRPADKELYEQIVAGEYCYILTPRQMGKSSLMVRTARRLREVDIRSCIIDLNLIGKHSIDIDQWYAGLVEAIQRDLHLETSAKEWWQQSQHISPPQRFSQYLTDIALPGTDSSIAIFVDEIDSTLALDFSDDFFALIRSLYNARATNPELELDRLTIVLLGVASPTDLISDQKRTPYNIGQEINLTEFEFEHAEPLLKGLEAYFPGQGADILQRIFYWTSGHPYLTQQLCASISKNSEVSWDDGEIDSFVRQHFLSDKARGEENIRTVRDMILESDIKRELLGLYRRVYGGKIIPYQRQSVAQSQLLLSGVVKTEDNHLVVRNEIYRQAFDREWVKKEMAINWAPIVAVVSMFVALVAIGILVRDSFLLPSRLDGLTLEYSRADTDAARVAALAEIAQLRPLLTNPSPYENTVRVLFFGETRTWQEQQQLFNPRYHEDARSLFRITRLIYVALANSAGPDNTPILRSMRDSLADSKGLKPEELICDFNDMLRDDEDGKLICEIQEWLLGRDAAEREELESSIAHYNNAIRLNGENPATLYDRANVYISRGDYGSALEDLEAVVGLAIIQSENPEDSSTPTSESADGVSPQLVVTSTSTVVVTGTRTAGLDGTTIITPSEEPAPPTAQVPSSSEEALPPFSSRFITRQDQRELVRNLISRETQLFAALDNAPEGLYPNLRALNLIFEIDLIVDRDDDQSGLACTTAANDCTLRSALEIANQDGRASTITFADHMIITLTSPLPALLEPGTSIVARTDQEVHVNGNDLPGTVIRVAALDSVIDGLRIYGANGNANVTLSGQAYNVRIANNLIGDDDQQAEFCGQSDLAYAGIYIDASGAMPEGMVGRVYVVNNIVECNRGAPGDGIMILTDGVFIGQDSSGAVSGNTIRHNRGTAVVVQGPGNTVRGNRINANGGAIRVSTFENNAILENALDTSTPPTPSPTTRPAPTATP